MEGNNEETTFQQHWEYGQHGWC